MTTIARKAAEEIASLIAVGIEWGADPEIERQSVTAIIQRAIDASHEWQPIETAPKDGTLFLVWAPGREGLPPMYSLCAWHPDAGFCIDELREPTHWMPLPAPPKGDAT